MGLAGWSRVGLVGALLVVGTSASAQSRHYRSIGSEVGTFASGPSASIRADSDKITFGEAPPESVGLGDIIELGGESFFVIEEFDNGVLRVEPPAVADHLDDAWGARRAFNDLDSWESARERNLVADDSIEIGVVRGTLSPDALATRLVDIEGYIVDADHFVMLMGIPEHGGQVGIGATLAGGNADIVGVRVRQSYTRVQGLDINGFSTGLEVIDNPTDVRLDRLLVHDNGVGISVERPVTLRNSLIFDNLDGVLVGGASRVDNCTVFRNIDVGVFVSVADVEIRNTIAVSNGTDLVDQPGGNLVQEFNISSDDSAAGEGSQTGVVPADLFVSFEETVDLHLLEGSPAANAGIDLSLLFEDDVDYQQREEGAWDIGADEQGSALPTVAPTGDPTPEPTPGPGANYHASGSGCACRLQSPRHASLGMLVVLLLSGFVAGRWRRRQHA